MGFQRLIVEHFHVNLVDPSCIGWHILRKSRQTHRQTEGKSRTTATASAWVMALQRSRTSASWCRRCRTVG